MSVRKRTWHANDGSQREKWMVHIEHTLPDGTRRTIRRVSPVQTKRGAEAFERELRRSLLEEHREEPPKRNTFKKSQPKDREVPTLAGFAVEFLAYQGTLNKPTELESKRSILNNHLLPAFGSWQLDEIDTRSIDRYKIAKLAPPKPGKGVKSTRRTPTKGLSPKTINNHLTVLVRMLNVAAKWELIVKTPAVEKLATRSQPYDFLDFEEADRFIEAAKEHVPEWYPFAVVSIRTGLRVGELLALRWRRDVNLPRARLRIQEGYTRIGGFDTPKSECSERELPLTWDAVAALEVQRRRVRGPLVFPNEVGEVGSLRSAGHFIGKIGSCADLRHVHPHMLRHTFASHAVMRGVPLRIVQEWLGHESITMTQRYAHLAQGVGDQMMARLAPPRDDIDDGRDHRTAQ